MTTNPAILVLCTGNSCRSQIAEGFLRTYKNDRFEIHSAGTEPKHRVHPLAIRVMQEIGIDISNQRPKHMSQFLSHQFIHHLLIVCDNANKTCPRIWPGSFSRTYMPFDDPTTFVGDEAQKLAEFRRVRDLIGKAMRDWAPQSEKANS